MGILDRLEDVIKSYLNDEDEGIFRKSSKNWKERNADPDVEAAYRELNDYLKGDSESKPFHAERGPKQPRPPQEPPIPDSIKRDFAELGLTPGASSEDCKRAYKKLLKIHHPDRHAGHPENMRKATEKSARINTAFDRIERWRRTGKSE
jgi:DnaJ-class molecular chaperone